MSLGCDDDGVARDSVEAAYLVARAAFDALGFIDIMRLRPGACDSPGWAHLDALLAAGAFAGDYTIDDEVAAYRGRAPVVLGVGKEFIAEIFQRR